MSAELKELDISAANMAKLTEAQLRAMPKLESISLAGTEDLGDDVFRSLAALRSINFGSTAVAAAKASDLGLCSNNIDLASLVITPTPLGLDDGSTWENYCLCAKVRGG